MPQIAGDLTDHVKELMVSPSNADVPSLRKSLRERLKEETRKLYDKSFPIKESRDAAHNVLCNVHHQEVKDDVPLVQQLLRQPEAAAFAKPTFPLVTTSACQTSAGSPSTSTITVDPQRSSPRAEVLTEVEKQPARRSCAANYVDRGTGREMRSAAIEAKPTISHDR
jgi:hypothetical protein